MIFRFPCISAHLEPLCRELHRKLKRFKFVYQSSDPGAMRRRVGWTTDVSYETVRDSETVRNELENCDVLVTGVRDVGLFERRTQKGLRTFYMSERWLKPRWYPGVVKLLHPCYRQMARRLARLMDSDRFWLLPIGVYAARDFVRIYRIFHGARWRFLLREADVDVERTLGGCVAGFPRVRLWSYFVEMSKADGALSGLKRTNCASSIRLLWVGRMLPCKHVETILVAAQKMPNADLLVVGEGVECARLRKLAGARLLLSDEPKWAAGRIVFTPYQRNEKVRELMRQADVFVMASDAVEGWGAVVSEALSEGCRVVSSREVGSAATLLPEGCLYRAKDPEGLIRAVTFAMSHDVRVDMSRWSGARACDIILKILKGRKQ